MRIPFLTPNNATQPVVEAPLVAEEAPVRRDVPPSREFDAEAWTNRVRAYFNDYPDTPQEDEADQIIRHDAPTAVQNANDARGRAQSVIDQEQATRRTKKGEIEAELTVAKGAKNRLAEQIAGLERKFHTALAPLGIKRCPVVTGEGFDAHLVACAEAQHPKPQEAEEIEDPDTKPSLRSTLIKTGLLMLAGVVLGLTAGNLFHFITVRDIQQGKIGFNMILSLLTGQGFAFGITYAVAILTGVAFSAVHKSRQEKRALYVSEIALVGSCIALCILFAFAEMSVEAYGLKSLFQEFILQQKRRKINVEAMPILLFYILGSIVSLPLIAQAGFGTWKRLNENADKQEKANLVAAAETARQLQVVATLNQMRLHRSVREALELLVQIDQLRPSYHEAEQEVTRLTNALQPLKERVTLADIDDNYASNIDEADRALDTLIERLRTIVTAGFAAQPNSVANYFGNADRLVNNRDV